MRLERLKERLARLLEPADLRTDEPMSAHTSFRVGGPADVWARPSGQKAEELATASYRAAREEDVPVFVLGGGANLVVADRGVRGLVLDLTGCASVRFVDADDGVEADAAAGGRFLIAGAGLAVDEAVEACAARSRGGPEFLAGMPGTIGGALWMNARCYGRSISDLRPEAAIIDEDLRTVHVPFDPAAYDYKKSPFQHREILILSIRLTLAPRPEAEIRAEATELRADRERKGHYRLPSAGSAFKNDYRFGTPTGKIVDDLGLRGLRRGGAMVADWHGNIIVNAGGATAADIRALVDDVAARVRDALGLVLEPEILFVGDW